MESGHNQRLDDQLGTRSIARGRVDHCHTQQQSERVRRDVSLASPDLFATAEAPDHLLFGCFHTVGVQDCHRRTRIKSSGGAHMDDECIVDLLPGAVVTPKAKVVYTVGQNGK
jgi:hypothetical protein